MEADVAETVPFVPPVPQQLTDEEVLAALQRLPAALQEVIVLCDVEELKYREIAGVLGIPLGTVMSRLHRGRALLRQALSRHSRRRRRRKDQEMTRPPAVMRGSAHHAVS